MKKSILLSSIIFLTFNLFGQQQLNRTLFFDGQNRSFIISSDKNSIPKNAGIEKKIPNFIAFEIL